MKFFSQREDEIDFNSFTRFSFGMFRFAHFDFEKLHEGATFKEKFIYNVKRNYVRFGLGTFAAAVISLTANAIINNDNMVIVSSSFTNLLTIALIALKYLNTYLHKNDIWEIIQEMRAIYNGTTDQRTKFDVRPYLRAYQRVIKIAIVTFSATVFSITYPIFPFLVDGTMRFEINYWYPFDPFTPKSFVGAMVWVDWMAVNCTIFLIACDSMVYALITVISMEFDFLKIDLMHLSNVPKHERAKEIKRLTDHHNKLLDISDKLEKCYSPTFLASFVETSMILCLIAFELSTASDDLSKFKLYIPYLGVMGGQMLVLCIFGQKLLDSSESIADGIYNCQWEEFPDSAFKKQLILMIQRAQKPNRLTAMKYAVISLETCTRVSKNIITSYHINVGNVLN